MERYEGGVSGEKGMRGGRDDRRKTDLLLFGFGLSDEQAWVLGL